MIEAEAEFVFQLLVSLLDRPALMGEADEGAQRRGGRQVHQVVLRAVVRSRRAFAEVPHLGRESVKRRAPPTGGAWARSLRPGCPSATLDAP